MDEKKVHKLQARKTGMMTHWIIYSIGFVAQLLFSSRLLLQWIASEKRRKVVTPGSFWVYSLIASFLLFVYGYLRNDFPIMLGQIITYFIYIRNFQIRGEWERIPGPLRFLIVVFPLLIIIYYYNNNKLDMHNLFVAHKIEPWLLTLGIAGQLIFTFRFILQWLNAEKIKESVLPPAFWYFSILGSIMIISYAIFRKDPVLFIGQAFGLIVYTRNVILLIQR